MAAVIAIIVLLVMAWPKPYQGPDHITIRVTNGPTVLSTTTVPLR